jgi:phospholipid transport system substrate-binding protein
LPRAAAFSITNARITAFDRTFMSISRRLLLGLPLVLTAVRFAHAADASTVPAVIKQFYDELLALMKVAKRLRFEDRYNQISPAVSRTFDLALMTRIAVGPGWPQIDPAQQQRLTGGFTRYTISEYASRFDDFGGERFEVTPAPAQNPNGVMVMTKLIKGNGEAVPLNYLMRQDATGGWKVIDVYLSGTISELASRRSEFAAVLRRSGAEGLVQLLEQKTAALRTK